MTKRLILMRHAHASDSASTDFERHLSNPGRRQAREVGQFLESAGIEYALVSAAVRAQETFAEMKLGVPSEKIKALYDCSADTMMSKIAEADEAINTLLVVAHAPAIVHLASRLQFYVEAEDSCDVRCHFCTSDYAIFEFDLPWAHLAERFFNDQPLGPIRRL